MQLQVCDGFVSSLWIVPQAIASATFTLKLGITWLTIILMQSSKSSTLFHRWRSLSSPSSLFFALWLPLPCIGSGWMANVKDEIFLRGLESTLWLETFFQCPAHSNGRHFRSGDENIVCDRLRLWSSALYSFKALCRFRYYSRQRIRDVICYLKLVRSRDLPSRSKIQYLLQ